MTLPGNGRTKIAVLGIAAALITSGLSWYGGWSSKVEASVTQQRMVNAHDATLQAIVPTVNECHEVNEVQKFQIAEHDRALTRLERSIEKTNDLVQQYLQTQMRRGYVPR
jgi:hypothetical protein